MAVELELQRRTATGELVPWTVYDDGTEPVADLGVRERLDLLIAAQRPQSYMHFQATPSTTWLIPHGLGRFPAVTILDSLGRKVEGDVDYPNADTARASFAYAFSGSAHCS